MMIKFPRAAAILAGLCWAGTATAQPAPAAALAKVPEYQQAFAALRDQLPEVAVVKLRRVMESGKLKPDQRGPVLLLLAEALVRTGRPADALTITDDAALQPLPESKFWRAQALSRLNRWREAEQVFEALGAVGNFRYAVETAFSRAGMLAALGEPERAAGMLTPLRQPPGTETAARAGLWLAELRLAAGQPAEAAALLAELGTAGGKLTPERQYLKARIALGAGDAVAADALFAVLASEISDVPSRLQQAARLGRARALRVQGKTTEALPVLRQVITTTPPPPAELMEVAFQELETLNHPPTAEMESFLNSQAAATDPELKIRARMALAAALESGADPRLAGAAWEAIPKDFPDHPLLALALLREAQFLTSQGRRKEVQPFLEQLRKLSPSPAVAAWTAWVAGQAEYDASAYRAASGYFMEASANSPDPSVRAAAAYNAALAELQSGVSNPARSLALLEGSNFPGYAMAGAEFHLERALRLASRGEPEAIKGLEAFAENLPDHPRRFEALIALAEVALRSNPAQATPYLAAAGAAAMQPWQQERAALLECYVAEASGGPDALTAKAEKFLTRFPQSASRTDLRMKMAQLNYRRGNFSGARQLFETIAADDPLHPLAEPALFWAGRAALLSLEPTADQQAVALWEKVFQRNGPLKWQARLQEALLNQRQSKPAAALQLIEEILTATAAAPEASTRWQALSVRGEILAAPGMKPAEQALGLQSFDEVIRAADLPAGWHRQTLVRKGVRLESLERTDEALESYYDVLSDPPPAAGGGNTPDDYWFHRAGVKACRLLEKGKNPKAAIEIAKKLAKTPGPRGRAAAELVDELAFKYGIWDSSP